MKHEKSDANTNQKIDADLIPISNIVNDFYSSLGDGTRDLLGIQSGICWLDKATLGLDGCIYFVGFPGVGKTAFALQVAFESAILGTPVLYYSLELPSWSIIAKIMSRISEQKLSDILLKSRPYLYSDYEKKRNLMGKDSNKGQLTDDQMEKLILAKKIIKKTEKLFYLRSKDLNLGQINLEEEIVNIQNTHQIENVLVVIDHLRMLRLMDSSKIKDKNVFLQQCRDLTKKTGSTILLIDHLKNNYLHSNNDIYLADTSIILKNSKDSGEKTTLDEMMDILGKFKGEKKELLILKNKFNDPKKVDLEFFAHYSKFVEII